MSGHAHDRPPRAVDTDRARGIRNVLWGVLFINLAVAISKLTVGTMVGATSLIADGIHSLLDGASNGVGLVGQLVAKKPPDAGHPYGHRRFETLAALGIALLIGAGLYEILHAMYANIMRGAPSPAVTWWSAVFVAATVVINLGVSSYEARRGRELGSVILQADSAHTYADALSAVAVLAAFIATKFGVPYADPVATFVVAGFIAHTAWRLFSDNIDVLADGARLDPVAVHGVAMAVPGVLDAHQIRSRGAGDWTYVDLHIQVDGEQTVNAAHDITHVVVDAIRDAFPSVRDVVIHTEPEDHDAEIAPGVPSEASSSTRPDQPA